MVSTREGLHRGPTFDPSQRYYSTCLPATRGRSPALLLGTLLLGTLLLGTILLASGSFACASREPQSPAEAARAKVAFLRQHGTSLTPSQIGQLERIPYRSRRRMAGEMERVLELQKVKVDRRHLGERRSVLELAGERVKKREYEEPPP